MADGRRAPRSQSIAAAAQAPDNDLPLHADARATIRALRFNAASRAAAPSTFRFMPVSLAMPRAAALPLDGRFIADVSAGQIMQPRQDLMPSPPHWAAIPERRQRFAPPRLAHSR